MEQATTERPKRDPLPPQEECWAEAQRTDHRFRTEFPLHGAFPGDDGASTPLTMDAFEYNFWAAHHAEVDSLEELLAEMIDRDEKATANHSNILERQQEIVQLLLCVHHLSIKHMEQMQKVTIKREAPETAPEPVPVPVDVTPTDLRRVEKKLEIVIFFQVLILCAFVLTFGVWAIDHALRPRLDIWK